MAKMHRNIILAAIVLISVAMHFNHFSKELMSIHVWRQTQTQSTIISFYEENMNILNPHRNERGNGDGIFRMEFPLMQWLVACLYKVFGNHLIISRLFMFVVGLFSVLGIYTLIKNIFQNETAALIGAWAFNFSPAFYYYTINPLPDNFALCCSIWGIAFCVGWYRNAKLWLLFMSGIFLSVGALCKLPFILYFSVPLAFILFDSFRNGITGKTVLKTFLSSGMIILPLAWYLYVVPQWSGNGIVKGIFEMTISLSVYFDFALHHLISTLPELLLNYGSVLFFIVAFYFIFKHALYKKSLFYIFLLWSIAIIAYFFFELNMIGKIHDYYLFPFYPLLFIIMSYGAYNLYSSKKIFKCLTFFLLLILPITAYLRMHTRWNPDSPGFNKDLLIYKEDLRKAVPKDALCIAGNDISHFIIFYYIDKKGWGFDNDDLTAEKVKKMINDGAQYLYSDSRQLETNPDIAPFLDNAILEKGSIRIFRLKTP